MSSLTLSQVLRLHNHVDVVSRVLLCLDDVGIPLYAHCYERLPAGGVSAVYGVLSLSVVGHGELPAAVMILDKLAAAEFVFVTLRVAKGLRRGDPAFMSLLHLIHALFVLKRTCVPVKLRLVDLSNSPPPTVT